MESNSDIIFSAHAHGKILLSGEYAILDGAKGFAIPLKKGQSLQIGKATSTDAYILSLDVEGNPWFEARFHPETLGVEMPIGTKEMLECSGRGLCSHDEGTCICFNGFGPSDRKGGPGLYRDCGYQVPISIG